MRQNAGQILTLAGFKRLISAIKYQELLPDPFDANEFFKSGFGSRPLGNRKWVSKLINDYFSSIRNRLHKRLSRIGVEADVYFGGDFVGEVEELLAGGDGHEEVFGSFIGCGFDDA